ncbi:hypothetical protein NMG29_00500 [Streptomyces cocklensis]|jgi:hypothetical protein|uniref:Uncharacterized protein n=1 Tax=Actinacidiphila cocklensis TaxID=887465 RepID=A0A9W4GUR3_9ACTN|nr:hypothetical protein [Actinacidiphila cocklensis]MDD1056729.1 hypothetical protein [Actinacidiphila cocklensis]WSX77886.1 hypothetical protein OH826_31015 [Streptomyces sp. NBC_00899]CAG6397796.1 conserved hypothetical protein [Actinacidiphila cocklensis]
MTHYRMTTQTSHSWDSGASVGREHKHARAGRPSHHAAGALTPGRMVLLAAAALLVVAAVFVVAFG